MLIRWSVVGCNQGQLLAQGVQEERVLGALTFRSKDQSQLQLPGRATPLDIVDKEGFFKRQVRVFEDNRCRLQVSLGWSERASWEFEARKLSWDFSGLSEERVLAEDEQILIRFRPHWVAKAFAGVECEVVHPELAEAELLSAFGFYLLLWNERDSAARAASGRELLSTGTDLLLRIPDLF